MFQLKPISTTAIPAALERANRYRLLNEPDAAESICLDVLEADPKNHEAVVTLLLARTDLISAGIAHAVLLAREVLPRLQDPYERAYYAGLICERRAHAQLKSHSMGASAQVYDWYREAMEHYAEAEKIRPAGNDEALLRWNTCARVLNSNPTLRATETLRVEPTFDD